MKDCYLLIFLKFSFVCPGRIQGFSKPQGAEARTIEVLSWRIHHTGDHDVNGSHYYSGDDENTGANDQLLLFQTHGSSNGDFNHHALLSKKTQGSSNVGVVDAIQLELPVDLINSTEYRYSKQIVNFLDEDNISHQHESTLFQDKNGSFCWRCDC